jgi:predicted GNAT family acetyltransferase
MEIHGVMEVHHNEAAHQFEAGTAPNPAKLQYRMQGSAVNMFHTEVPPEYQGQGLAGKLAAAALDWARAKGLKVIPGCPYIQGYVGKHPEYADLV